METLAGVPNGTGIESSNIGEIELSDLLTRLGQQKKRIDRGEDNRDDLDIVHEDSEQNITSVAAHKRRKTDLGSDFDWDGESWVNWPSPTSDEEHSDDSIGVNVWYNDEDIEKLEIGTQNSADAPGTAFENDSEFFYSQVREIQTQIAENPNWMHEMNDDYTLMDFWDPEESILQNQENTPLQVWGRQPNPSLRSNLENNTICYGMIHQVRVKVLPQTPQLLKDIEAAQITFGDSHQPPIYHFAISREGVSDSYFLQFPELSTATSHKIAVLNRDTSKTLSKIASVCTFTAYSPPEPWAAIIGQRTIIEKNTFILVDIVLYGLSTKGVEVGDILTTDKVYLQEPDYWRPELKYNNPHFLDLSEVHQEVSSAGDSSTPSLWQIDFGFQPEGPEESPVIETRLKQKVAAALKNTTRAGSLKRIAADIRISTPLKTYQEEALDFISQREHGPIPPKYSLWKPKSISDGALFANIITGCARHEMPTETGGGILADEMGLGKTLTMLSAIISTTDDAKAFANHDDTGSRLTTPQNTIHSRATLIVVPTPLLISEWRQEIRLHCTGFSNIIIYHNQGREGDARILADSDIVLSTYHTISHEATDKTSPLYKINWFRIILDEAHIIRGMKTKIFKAMKKLHANFRWCLTGTPVQNSLEDLAALISFIRSSPLDDLHKFRRHIISPLVRGSENCVENLSKLLDCVCLRRTKQLLNLPDVASETRLLNFSAREQQQYEYTRDKLINIIKQSKFNAKSKRGNLGVFQLQLQLRRLCNHGTFQRLSLDAEGFDPEQAISLLKKDKEATCEGCQVGISAICGIRLPATRSGSFTVCGHLLCIACVPRMIQALQKVDEQEECFKCSLCLEMFQGDYIIVDEGFAKQHKVGSKRLSPWQYFDKSGCSTKVSAIIKDLEESKTDGKSIIFSCWTRSLDLVGIFLKSHNIPFLRIDGSHSHVQRNSILARFQSDAEIKILLMTTGTGAFGLNLTVANCVYLLEPQWNPMVESQAIGRVLRLGQERNVRVVRYIMKGTVEEVEMQSQQKRKIEYSKVGWNEDVCEKTAICT